MPAEAVQDSGLDGEAGDLVGVWRGGAIDYAVEDFAGHLLCVTAEVRKGKRGRKKGGGEGFDKKGVRRKGLSEGFMSK